MKKRRGEISPVVGSGSLLTVLAVLCLTALTVLSLATVSAEKRLADAAVKAMEDYYAADCRAEEMFAQLRRGEQVPGVESSGDVYRYQCAVSGEQSLEVVVRRDTEGWRVLRWQTAVPEPEIIETICVWDGKEGTP